MIAYQAQAGVVDYDGLAIQINRVYIDGNFVYKIRADLPQLDEPVELAAKPV